MADETFEDLAKYAEEQGIALTSAAHPIDHKTVERLCRAATKAEGLDPDREAEGLGVLMPRGMHYKLWEVKRPIVQAVLDELAIIDCELADAIDPNSTETVEITMKAADAAWINRDAAIGEMIGIEVNEGETLHEAILRQGVMPWPQPRYCVDCAHHAHKAGAHHCMRKHEVVINPVTGNPRDPIVFTCDQERMSSDLCGPAGRFWSPTT